MYYLEHLFLVIKYLLKTTDLKGTYITDLTVK